MATNGNQTRMEASVAAQRTSPSAAAGKPGRGVQRASNNQEEQRHSDRLWLPKQRSSPSLLFYRRLSDDSSEGAASNEEYDCLDLGAARGAPLQPSAFRTTSSEEGRGGNTCRNSRCCTAPGNCSFHSSASSPTSSASPDDSPQLTSSPARPNPRHSRRSSLPVSMLPFHTTSPCLSSCCGISSEPNSLGSSPAASPLVNHRQRRHNGHVHRDYHKDGYSSLERLNRRPRVNKCSREKFFLRRASLQTVTMRSLRGEEVSSSPATRNCSREGSSSSSGNSSNSDEEFGGGFSDSADFIRNRKERSTVLVRRFFKNNQKVTKSVCTGTRAIVKTLPSGRISEEVWELVDSHGSRRPSKREVWPILKRLVGGEELRISKGILRLVRVELHLVTRYVQDKKELPLTHPAEKLLLQRSRCACRRSTLAASDDPTGTNRYHPCWCGTSHPHSFYRACLQRTLLCSLLTGALLEATAALGARSALPYPPTQGLNCQAVLKERQLANSMTSSSSLSPSLSGISKELVEMRHLVQFPEEIACILTEQEQQLYQRVFPLDYLCFLTRDLSSPDAQSKRHPSLRASLSVPAMPSQSAQRSSPVEDLVARFNEVKGRRWGYRRHREFEEK